MLTKEDPIYILWLNIKAKCLCKTNKGYKYYGLRGITIHIGWIDDFESFKSYILDNLGQRPPGLTLDRIDNEGNYVPGNLRWATRTQQVHNRRPSVVITNTNEHHISLITLYNTYSVGKPDGTRVQNIKSINEAIKIRNQFWIHNEN